MTKTDLIGKEHNAHLEWLLNTWMNGNRAVCFLEGFPGTGKTTIARELLSRVLEFKIPAVMITAPETEKDPTDDILLNLAMEFNSAGKPELASAIENNRPLLEVLSTLINDPVLIIIDEFQHSMDANRGITTGGFAKVLSNLANRRQLRGRILLLTNRFVERAAWSDPYIIKTLNGMNSDDGVELLEHFAQECGRSDEIPLERRRDVVKWLGGNPRAIQLLVRNLAYESLDDLIGIQPELWEMRDREVSAELIEKLERSLLERTLNQLSEDNLRPLYRLSAHRKPFKKQAIEHLFDKNDKARFAQFKAEMINRFLMEHHKGWFNLHPIVREIGLQKLAQSATDIQHAHSIVATYYTRHFDAKQIVGWGVLGGHFVESRYHLTKAGKFDELKDIASHFQTYIFSTLSEESPIPSNAEELDERIAVLSALLETPGPKSLEYHLARLFKIRNQRNDLRRALQHANRARSKNPSIRSWMLCSEILDQMGQPDEAINVLQQGIDYILPIMRVDALYHRCASLLIQQSRYDEAITILQQGISHNKGAVALYDIYARLLIRQRRYDEATVILNQGISHVAPDKHVVELYIIFGELLIQDNRYDEAINIFNQGIREIPPDKGVVDLYHSLGELMVQIGKYDDAIAILRQGIDNIPIQYNSTPRKKGFSRNIEKIPSNKGLVALYHSLGELLAQRGQNNKAIALLQQGVNRIPIDQCFPIYGLYGDLLFQMNQKDRALSILKNGINLIPPDKGVSLVYDNYVRLLLNLHQTQKAIEILLFGIKNLPVNNSLIDSLLMLYAGLHDVDKLYEFVQNKKGVQLQHLTLAQALIYQLQGNWESAARYVEQLRSKGNSSSLLVAVEAFSWLCSNNPRYALEVVSTHLDKKSFYNYWLYAFIQLRLGNIDVARSAIITYDKNLTPINNIDETTLLKLWDRPSNTLKQYDLAYYFPNLPSILTGFSHDVTRIANHPSVLHKYFTNTTPVFKGVHKQNKISPPLHSKTTILPENYINLDIHITATGHIIASSSEGEARDFISIHPPSVIRLALRLIEQEQTDADLIKEIGVALYDWLFPTSIHTHLEKTEAVARNNNSKLRLNLRIEAASIASLPLEFTYRASRGYFLAVNPDTVFSRYLNVSLPPKPIRNHEGPLHILIIIANPSDQVQINPYEWQEIIKQSVDQLQTNNEITLEVVNNATRKDIRNALIKQKPNIIQFIGHGTYQDGKGYISLVKEGNGKTWLVDEQSFADIFMGYDEYVGLIILAACNSGQSNDPQGFLGIAPQLVQRGTPAVIAMQYPIYIKSAKVFLDDFYAAVAARKPIDWALQSARNALSLEFGYDQRDFATPVLYMRAKDGKVF